MDAELLKYKALDARMVALVKDIKLLSVMSWPKHEQEVFLEAYHRGNPALPNITYRRFDYGERRRELDQIVAQCDPTHPIGVYLLRTAQSWEVATLLLEALGTPKVTDHSVRLFGKPGDRIAGSDADNIQAAQHFIKAADEILGNTALSEPDLCLPAHVLQAELEAHLNAVFTQHVVRIVVDPDLVAKAAAGPTRIRLRSATCFSEYDLSQLLEHEAFVHSLTSLNGRMQTNLSSLGLNSPRITATQEGLAVFAELVTGSIDIMRMKRISLRIMGIDMALRGANFIEVFDFFMAAGQGESDSFNSAMRVFRGSPTSGGSAFTKDTVYLHGLLSVHTFFRWALRSGKLVLAGHLFAGKMTLRDVVELEPFVAAGFIDPPMYLPPWMKRTNGLAGYLSFSSFVNRIRLDQVEREHVLMGV